MGTDEEEITAEETAAFLAANQTEEEAAYPDLDAAPQQEAEEVAPAPAADRPFRGRVTPDDLDPEVERRILADPEQAASYLRGLRTEVTNFRRDMAARQRYETDEIRPRLERAADLERQLALARQAAAEDAQEAARAALPSLEEDAPGYLAAQIAQLQGQLRDLRGSQQAEATTRQQQAWVHDQTRITQQHQEAFVAENPGFTPEIVMQGLAHWQRVVAESAQAAGHQHPAQAAGNALRRALAEADHYGYNRVHYVLWKAAQVGWSAPQQPAQAPARQAAPPRPGGLGAQRRAGAGNGSIGGANGASATGVAGGLTAEQVLESLGEEDFLGWTQKNHYEWAREQGLMK